MTEKHEKKVGRLSETSTDTFNLQPSNTLREKAKKITRWIVTLLQIFRACKCNKKALKKKTTNI